MLIIAPRPTAPAARDDGLQLGDRLTLENAAALGLLGLACDVEDNLWHTRACIYFPVKEAEHRLLSKKYSGCTLNGNSYMKSMEVRHLQGMLFPGVVTAKNVHEWRHYVLIAEGLPRGSFVVVWYREEYLDGRYESPLCNLLRLRTPAGLRVLGETVALVVMPVVERKVDLRTVFALPMMPIHHAESAYVNVSETAMRVTNMHQVIQRAQTLDCKTAQTMAMHMAMLCLQRQRLQIVASGTAPHRETHCAPTAVCDTVQTDA